MEKKSKKEKTDNNLADKVKKKSAKRRHHTQFYYSFLTIILLICLVQMSFSALLNVTKVVSYHRKIALLKSKQAIAEIKNEELKKDNLKMAGKDEMLIIVNKQAAPADEKHKKIGFKK